MRYVAKFEKVSYEQFKKDVIDTFPDYAQFDDEIIENIYNNIQLPVRGTKGSAGYDIKSPFGFDLSPKEAKKIPTGLRCIIDEDYVMLIAPRSSLGFKYGMGLVNTIPVVDSDYSKAKNEGHIFLKFRTDKTVVVDVGDGVAQAMFIPYGITVDDEVVNERTGGIGSTGR